MEPGDVTGQGEGAVSLDWHPALRVDVSVVRPGTAAHFTHPDVGLAELVNLVCWVFFTLGFFGYAFLKRIFRPGVWLPVLVINIAYGVFYEFFTKIDLRAGMSDMDYYISLAIGWGISLPALYALYAYSKPTDLAWRKSS